MKDAYTFDRDAEGLDARYEHHREAYDRIFDRCGLEWYRVESDVGMMGGIGAHEYMAPCAAGENDVALAPGYAANVEIATRRARSRSSCPAGARRARGGRDARPDDRSTRSRGALGVPEGALLKAFPVIVERPRARARAACAATTASTRSSSRNALGAAFRPAREDEFAERIGPAGYIGPVGADVPILLDDAVGAGRATSPAPTATDAHLRGVEPGRDFPFERADVRRVEAGRPRRRAPDPDRAGDRGRQHLQARHALLGAARRDLPRRERHRAADLDGLLRHRPGAHRRRRGRAVRRRAGHLLAARARAVRRPARRARQAGHATSARSPSGSTTSCARPGLRRRSTTTATPGRARSSPTPSCSAARCG